MTKCFLTLFAFSSSLSLHCHEWLLYIFLFEGLTHFFHQTTRCDCTSTSLLARDLNSELATRLQRTVVSICHENIQSYDRIYSFILV